MTTLDSRFQFMESQAAHIESRVRMIQYGSIQYPDLVGISREASPHADSIVYYSYDGTGDMVDLANRGTDYPFVETQQDQHTVPIQWKGLAYDWSDREIGRAQLVGLPLSDRKVRVAFRIAEEEKERVVLEGQSDYGWDSLIKHSSITVDSPNAAWDGATGDQIIDDVNDLLTAIYSGTNQVRIADTLLLPVVQMTRLATLRLPDTNMSVLEYLRKNNVYTLTTGNELMIRSVRQLATAGASNTTRAMAYTRDMDVLRFHVPQELQFIEPQRQGARWIYHGHMVLGGLEIMEPNACRYLDGI